MGLLQGLEVVQKGWHECGAGGGGGEEEAVAAEQSERNGTIFDQQHDTRILLALVEEEATDLGGEIQV